MAITTIPLQISQGKTLNISNARLHSHKVLSVDNDKIVINFLSRLTNYQYPLSPRIKMLQLTNDQYRKYRYRPKTLSFDLYGTIELGTALMRINGCVSMSEFNFYKLKVFDQSIVDALIEVMNKEKERITLNNSEVNNDIKASIFD